MPHMDCNYDCPLLEKKGVKPTSNRILVLKAMIAAARPVSLAELDEIIGTMDRSSIFRALTLFAANHVVHAIEDGGGGLRYEICDGGAECSLQDMHTHFYCERCHRTYCFKSIHIPAIEMPDGFLMHSINYMVKGICPQCAEDSSSH